jgi:hypothetical protein
MLENPVNNVILTLVGAFLAWLVYEVRKLKSATIAEVGKRTPEQWHWLLSELAKTFVKAAQQKYTELEPAVKYNYVKQQMYAQIRAYGFQLDDAMIVKIDALIESAVHDVKNEIFTPILRELDHTPIALPEKSPK